jgi:hypothetical protein
MASASIEKGDQITYFVKKIAQDEAKYIFVIANTKLFFFE